MNPDKEQIEVPGSEARQESSPETASTHQHTEPSRAPTYSTPEINLEAAAEQEAPSGPWYTLSFWQRFFNVDTTTILKRIAVSAIPYRPVLRQHIQASAYPDLYGPFWIITSLIFFMGMTGNIAAWTAFRPIPAHPAWHYDFTKITFATFLLYPYSLLLPLAIWASIRFKQQGIASFGELYCLVGYSFAVYVPVAFLSLIPSLVVRWVVLLLALVLSTASLLANTWSSLGIHTLPVRLVIIACVAAANTGLAILLEVYFFHYYAAKTG
eukprot:gnl/Trimastix_PCT/2036.p1 GENE.gnl/Trimastix_PCT/2036~~gnl/Trimastix_PCT/2036.p1  ORF type:complete len:268 (+),score=48.21 gnl/Trimastix_PCT/2036:616-1419(+)